MLYDVNVNRGTFTVSRSEYLKQFVPHYPEAQPGRITAPSSEYLEQLHERVNREWGEKIDDIVWSALQKVLNK